jgi:hypothetical protein
MESTGSERKGREDVFEEKGKIELAVTVVERSSSWISAKLFPRPLVEPFIARRESRKSDLSRIVEGQSCRNGAL